MPNPKSIAWYLREADPASLAPEPVRFVATVRNVAGGGGGALLMTDRGCQVVGVHIVRPLEVVWSLHDVVKLAFTSRTGRLSYTLANGEIHELEFLDRDEAALACSFARSLLASCPDSPAAESEQLRQAVRRLWAAAHLSDSQLVSLEERLGGFDDRALWQAVRMQWPLALDAPVQSSRPGDLQVPPPISVAAVRQECGGDLWGGAAEPSLRACGRVRFGWRAAQLHISSDRLAVRRRSDAARDMTIPMGDVKSATLGVYGFLGYQLNVEAGEPLTFGALSRLDAARLCARIVAALRRIGSPDVMRARIANDWANVSAAAALDDAFESLG